MSAPTAARPPQALQATTSCPQCAVGDVPRDLREAVASALIRASYRLYQEAQP